MRTIANTLRAYCQQPGAGDVDQSVLEVLGERTPEKKELAEMLRQKISGAFE